MQLARPFLMWLLQPVLQGSCPEIALETLQGCKKISLSLQKKYVFSSTAFP